MSSHTGFHDKVTVTKSSYDVEPSGTNAQDPFSATPDESLLAVLEHANNAIQPSGSTPPKEEEVNTTPSSPAEPPAKGQENSLAPSSITDPSTEPKGVKRVPSYTALDGNPMPVPRPGNDRLQRTTETSTKDNEGF
jgi:hypothetical protein